MVLHGSVLAFVQTHESPEVTMGAAQSQSISIHSIRKLTKPKPEKIQEAVAEKKPAQPKPKSKINQKKPVHKTKSVELSEAPTLEHVVTQELVPLELEPFEQLPLEQKQVNEKIVPSDPVSPLDSLPKEDGVPIVDKADFSQPPLPPIYPKMAIKRRQSGVVLVRVLLGPSGKIETSRVLKSSGFQLLDHAALESIKRWHFLPAKIGGAKIRSWVDVPVEFNLRRS